jgi:ribosome-associated protein
MAKNNKDVSRCKVRRILEISLEKKPLKPVVLDLKEVGLGWDYCLIMTSESKPQTQAIVEALKKASKKEGFFVHHIEDDAESEWVLLDYNDVVVHIFAANKRELYRLDNFFKKAKRVRFRFKKNSKQ